MSHIVCYPLAATAIKSYSPDLMVHPYLGCSNTNSSFDTISSTALSRISPLLSRLHTLVIGPGLGRDPATLFTVANLIIEARKRGLELVLDADALLVVQETPSLVSGYNGAVLTPNKAEFARLCAALKVETKIEPMEANGEEKGEQCAQLARALGGVTVLQKGEQDWISNGNTTLECTVTGGNKRSGGQGDTLSGCVGTFLAWKNAYLNNLWDHDGALKKEDLTLLSAFGASAITRMCSRRAFQKKGRAMQASDLPTELPDVFKDLFECAEEDIEKQL